MKFSTLSALYPSLAALPETLHPRVLGCPVARVPAGTVIFDERQPCQGFPFVVEGAIRVVKHAPNGRELPLYRVLPGESCLITSSCLLGKVDYNARGIAEADTTLLLVSRQIFEVLIVVPPFRDFVFEIFSERLAELMQLIEEVAFRKLDQRLAGLLLGKGPEIRTTHQGLADELGSVREIVSRLLKGFADQGLVRLGREQIEILDPMGLRRIAS